MRINVGCGATPTEGWLNLDNSLTVHLAHTPLAKLPMLRAQREFIAIIKKNGIRPGSALRIPVSDGTANVIYTSHMLEHLDRNEADRFPREAKRVLRAEGILRVVVPDLARLVSQYQADGDANAFLERSLLTMSRPITPRQWLEAVLVGPRHHLWMYDARSLCSLLRGAGFRDPKVLEPGHTTIPSPGGLDLRERESESLYVEAVR